MMVSKKAVHR